jgi:hypothetical protein
VLPSGGGPPPVITGVLAPTLHAGGGGLVSPEADWICDLGFRFPWINLDVLVSPTVPPSRSSSRGSLSSLHAPRISKRADWCGCGVERDYVTLRVLHALLWESLEAATVLTEAMFLNGRGTMGCHLEMSLALSRRRLHQPM